MPLVLVGLSHHEAPIEVRERLNCAPHALQAALAHLAACPGVREGVILSTCNRMEVYAVVAGGSDTDAYHALTQHLAAFHQVPETVFAARLFHKSEAEAVSHLLRVASGLDSLVLGEPQIQGQVKAALRAAQAAGCCGAVLDKLFSQALATGKRARSETGLGQGGFSIGHAAVGLAQRILDDFSRARVLILGAGKMSEMTAAYLQRSGVQFVVVANRTYGKAVALAQRLGGQAIQYDQFLDEMIRADIVIASTSAPHPIVRRDMLAPVMKKRRGKPLFLIDIALPRDIDPDVNGLENVYLRNIDDLQEIVEQQAQGRESEIGAAEQIVATETNAFLHWLRTREAVPVIAQLRAHLDALTEARLNILRARLGDVSDRQWQIIETQMRALADQVALEPTRRLKRAMSEAGGGAGRDRAVRSVGSRERIVRPALRPPGHRRALFGKRRTSGFRFVPRVRSERGSGVCSGSAARCASSGYSETSGRSRGAAMTFAVLNAIAFALYLAAAVCHGAVLFLRAPLAPTLTPEDRSGGRVARLGRPFLLAGLLAQFAAIGAWCVSTHHSPFASAYGTLAVLAWSIALAYLLVDWRGRVPAVGAIALLVACVTLFMGSLRPHSGLANAAFLNSQMVSLHVLTILASFALFALAFGCAALYLLQNKLLKKRDVHESLRRLPSLATLDTVAYHSVAYALPLLTLGLALGIAYIYSGAVSTPPAQWFADPHTALSFAAWGLYVTYLGARLGLGWRGVRLQYILLAGLVVALAIYALPTSTHRFTNGNEPDAAHGKTLYRGSNG